MKWTIMQLNGFTEATFLVRYLGIHITSRKLRKLIYKILVDKITRRINKDMVN